MKDALQRHNPQNTATPSARKSGNALLCTVGLAALAGVAVYASRNPRIPEGVHPIENFDLDRYLGKWYELARIDHSFEKGLQRTQAEYSLNPNGSIQVINRGFNAKRGEWKISHGTAKPTIAPDIAALKVSFFGPFYG
ncbi:MAG: lipocalin family protein, partial [Comamonas sp.]